jgi:hypothetical protein
MQNMRIREEPECIRKWKVRLQKGQEKIKTYRSIKKNTIH